MPWQSGSVVVCWPANQRVVNLIPILGHMPRLPVRSPVGSMWEAATHCCFSPSLSLSFPLSKM